MLACMYRCAWIGGGDWIDNLRMMIHLGCFGHLVLVLRFLVGPCAKQGRSFDLWMPMAIVRQFLIVPNLIRIQKRLMIGHVNHEEGKLHLPHAKANVFSMILVVERHQWNQATTKAICSTVPERYSKAVSSHWSVDSAAATSNVKNFYEFLGYT